MSSFHSSFNSLTLCAFGPSPFPQQSSIGDDDLAPSQTAGYKPGEEKTLAELAELDKEDESLARWKASLGLAAGGAAAGAKKVGRTPTLPCFLSSLQTSFQRAAASESVCGRVTLYPHSCSLSLDQEGRAAGGEMALRPHLDLAEAGLTISLFHSSLAGHPPHPLPRVGNPQQASHP